MTDQERLALTDHAAHINEYEHEQPTHHEQPSVITPVIVEVDPVHSSPRPSTCQICCPKNSVSRAVSTSVLVSQSGGKLFLKFQPLI